MSKLCKFDMIPMRSAHSSDLCKFDMIPMRSAHSSKSSLTLNYIPKSSLTLNYIPKSSLTLNYAAPQHVMLYYTRRSAACDVILSHLQCYTITPDPPPMESQTPHQRNRRPRRGN